MKEAMFLKELPSTYFIKLYHSFFEKNEFGSYYFCILMEYAPKGDLLSYYIKTAKAKGDLVDEETILKTCISVCKALKVLHSRNIVHKDIKPQNILLLNDLSVRVADLGISVSVANNQSKSIFISKVGTPIYTSPEVLRKEPFDFKVDIWALGCLLYYMACQQPPFKVTKAEEREEYFAQRKNRMSSPFIHQNPAGYKSPYRAENSSLSRKQHLEEMIMHE